MIAKLAPALLSLALLASALPNVGAQKNPVAALTALKAARNDVIKLGSQSRTELSRARRRCKEEPAARALLQRTREEVKDIEADKVEKDEVKRCVDAFLDASVAFVAYGEEGIPAARALAASLEGAERAFVELAEFRCIAKEAIDVIKTYLSADGSVSGNFNGMFDSLRRFEAMPAVFLDLFLDTDQEDPIRSLAGEGVAQFCKANDPKVMALVKELMDGFDKEEHKQKAKWVLCRLGDTELLDRELGQYKDQIKVLSPKGAALQEEIPSLATKILALDEKKEPTDEEKAEGAKLKAEHGKKMQELVGALWGISQANQQIAWTYMQVVRYDAAEKAYQKSLDMALSILPYIRNNPGAISQINNTYYNLACAQSKEGKPKDALANIERAFMFGYSSYEWMEKDGDLEAMRALPEYSVLVSEVKSGERQKKWRLAQEAQQKAAALEAEKAKKAAEDAQKAKSGDGD